jgi:hypothetical protein
LPTDEKATRREYYPSRILVAILFAVVLASSTEGRHRQGADSAQRLQAVCQPRWQGNLEILAVIAMAATLVKIAGAEPSLA